MLDKSIRELDRERNNLQSQEKKLIAEIKKMAKQNQMGAVKARLVVVPRFGGKESPPTPRVVASRRRVVSPSVSPPPLPSARSLPPLR